MAAEVETKPSIVYIWNRWIANPVQHISLRDVEWYEPLCGRSLSHERMNSADQPSKFTKQCPRCQKKAEAL